ncbi:lysoplasmalogenase-like protein TMEM86A [Limulus polyphemus]|uniref:lysoplasmalogenase n=1 Tax=Limulus polyphemus TaxID=6850 RepID=A0ABM1BBZ4_LIMPO|nr:lysoplasmalogenase-like protein TMEM86A [Limulus polyphemus]
MNEKFPDVAEYWTSPKIVLKCVGPKLVPFFKTVAIYFVLAIPRENPSWFACLIKCLPVLSLCVFVLLHGISLGEKHAYSRRILAGMIFSCMGDALLIWPCCFIWGMASFAVGHFMYIWGFGMRPFNPIAGLVCAAMTIIGYYFLFPGLYGAYAWSVPLYILLLMIMVWRAVARVQLFEDLWTWTKLCSCGGGILFALSDGLIGIRMFHLSSSHPFIQTAIMVTYYAAQLGIALSVVDSTAMAVLSAANSTTSTINYCTPMKNEKPMIPINCQKVAEKLKNAKLANNSPELVLSKVE